MNRWLIAAAACAAFASPAHAQSDPSMPDPDQRGDNFTIGLGVGFVPDYEGSKDHRMIPAGAIRGKVGGISFATRGTNLYVDLIDSSGKVDIDVGPIVGVRLNRTGKIKDDFVDALPERKTAIEFGGFAGLSFKGLTNPYDSLGIRLDVVKDIGSAHESTIVSPSIEFGTPLSKSFYISASLSGDWTGGGYADYYFTITPADALASGLPAYDADGGFKNWDVSLLANQAITGDLTHGLSLFALASYGKLGGDFADSPIVDLRGKSGQTMGAIGLAYSF